jgi:hypothetical protein
MTKARLLLTLLSVSDTPTTSSPFSFCAAEMGFKFLSTKKAKIPLPAAIPKNIH